MRGSFTTVPEGQGPTWQVELSLLSCLEHFEACVKVGPCSASILAFTYAALLGAGACCLCRHKGPLQW